MKRLFLLGALLGAFVVAEPAGADTECRPKAWEWELELTRVECAKGDADLATVARDLGTQAILRGGFRDPNHPSLAPRAVLVGSTDGAGLNVGLEKGERP